MMRTLLVFPVVLTVAAAAARLASAEITVRIDPGPGAEFAQKAGLNLATVESELKTELERLFQTYRLNDYLRSFGDAQAFTTKGMGVDYASSNLSALMLGVAVNLSLNVEKGFVPEDTRSKPPVGGISSNATVMAGLNLGWLGLEPVTVYGNYFRHEGRFDDFDADWENFGGHLQVKLFRPHEERLRNAILRWGGLDITSGVEYGRMGLSLGGRLDTDIPLGDPASAAAHVAIESEGRLDIKMHTWSVPLELTTNFRLLYLVSVYGGVGFDWQVGGRSDMTADLTGSMTGIIPSQNVRSGIGTALVTASESAEPSAGQIRGLLGLQVNLWLARIFAQLNVAPGDPTLASLALGGRVAW